MTTVPDRNTFETAYAGQAPWDIGRPQQAFLDVADRITGPILDAGCGTGDNALFFASRGHKVTGIDFLEEPIQRAKRKAAERGCRPPSWSWTPWPSKTSPKCSTA
jgi:2-polyprenyl-3-methyl-5-hydroxy-6-metoxy-1,4-benzoquinol methylase